jgi:hypothetical protein
MKKGRYALKVVDGRASHRGVLLTQCIAFTFDLCYLFQLLLGIVDEHRGCEVHPRAAIGVAHVLTRPREPLAQS